MAERAQALRERLAAKGIDLSDEGDPVIADPKRFRDWARPAVSEARPHQPAPEPAPAPKPEPPPQPSGADRVTEQTDIWEMTPQQLREMIREEAEKIAQPWQQRVQQQGDLLGKRFVDEATQRVSDALTRYLPDYAHIVEHPDFGEMYRQSLRNVDPQYLDNPQVLASTAMGILPFLDAEQMPERKEVVGPTAARAAVNRSLVPQSRPETTGGEGMMGDRSREYSAAARWLAEKRVARIAPEDLEALDAVDEHGLHTIDAYVKAQKRLAKAKGRSR
jgi:hypothetical protein